MTIADIIDALELENLTPDLALDGGDLSAAYVSDLLSDVLAHAPDGGLLVTVQVHLNVVAVSVHAGLKAVVFALGRRPDEATQARAVEESVVLLGSALSSFEIAGRLYEMGLRGSPP